MSSIFLRIKAIVADRFCMTTAMRLVPLATATGMPIAINSAMVITEPPPPSVLMMPTTTPETSNKPISIQFTSCNHSIILKLRLCNYKIVGIARHIEALGKCPLFL